MPANKPGAVMTTPTDGNGSRLDAPPEAPAETPDDEPRGWRWTPSRIAVALTVLALVSMWVYVLYLAFGGGPQHQIDHIDDPAFAAAGEARCALALRAVGKLPLADESPNASARADVIDKANGDFTAMVDDLDRLATRIPNAQERSQTQAWLADWRMFIGNRQDYADTLRRDPHARMLVSAKGGMQITEWIDEFANANQMDSCVSPTDV